MGTGRWHGYEIETDQSDFSKEKVQFNLLCVSGHRECHKSLLRQCHIHVSIITGLELLYNSHIIVQE